MKNRGMHFTYRPPCHGSSSKEITSNGSPACPYRRLETQEKGKTFPPFTHPQVKPDAYPSSLETSCQQSEGKHGPRVRSRRQTVPHGVLSRGTFGHDMQLHSRMTSKALLQLQLPCFHPRLWIQGFQQPFTCVLLPLFMQASGSLGLERSH